MVGLESRLHFRNGGEVHGRRRMRGFGELLVLGALSFFSKGKGRKLLDLMGLNLGWVHV
jgi:hypothetical protein